MLFPISELIQEKDKLITVTKDSKIRDALAIMLENDYSQLPVVDEDGNLTGIITEQSILSFYFHLEELSLLNEDVDHCQTKAVTISGESDIFDALDLLQKTYAIVVLEELKPVGILTDYDTTNFFRKLSEGLILVQDIETTLKNYIENIFSSIDELDTALIRTFKADDQDDTRPSRAYDDLTLWDIILLIVTKGNWEFFEPYLQPKHVFHKLMNKVRLIRNQLAHFRGQLEPLQLNALKRATDWLDHRPRVSVDAIPVEILCPLRTVSQQQVVREQPEKYIDRGENVDLTKSKYFPLEKWLKQEKDTNRSLTLKFEDIENILGVPLPDSAQKHRAWWGNHYGNSQAKAWLSAGFLVNDVNFTKGTVTFRQSRSAYYPVFFDYLLTQLKHQRPGITYASKTSLDNWFSFSAGKSGFIFAWVLPREMKVRVELYIDTGDKEVNKAAFDALFESKKEIEDSIEAKLNWDRLDENRTSRISISKPYDVSDPNENHSETKTWALHMMLKFIDAFQSKIRSL